MRKVFLFTIIAMSALFLCACGTQSGLAEMESVIKYDLGCVVWEGRTYVPFCVVSKQDRGAQIGYVDGDKDKRISEYRGYSPQEWLVSWLPMDGGAMLLKEENVVDIPDGFGKRVLIE